MTLCPPEADAALQAAEYPILRRGNLLDSGEKKEETRKEEKGYYYVESSYGSFRRDVTLPADVEYGKVEAECKDGVLSIKLPKAEKAKALKVKVKG